MAHEKFIMPFGIHKDKTLEDVPLKYLDWLVGEMKEGVLRSVILDYLSDPVIQRELGNEIR